MKAVVEPRQFTRRVLLTLAIRSPQVVTETLYALGVNKTLGCFPTEIHFITTLRGVPQVEKLFSGSGSGKIAGLCNDYSLPVPEFHQDHIHLIEDDAGRPLNDVCSHDENRHAANYIMEQVRRFTADPDSSLIVSLSDGRRSMTYYIGYALSLFGRPQDRLTHVLVDEKYYNLEQFYYPPPTPSWLQCNDGTDFDASAVEVTLADIPFVRLRDGLPEELLQGNSSFSETVQAVQKNLESPKITVDMNNCQLYCGQQEVKLPPASMAFYCWFVKRKAKGLEAVNHLTGDPGEYIAIYEAIGGKHNGNQERVISALKEGEFSKEYFEQRKSRMQAELKKQLGNKATPYLLVAVGKRPHTRFEISLDRKAIHFV